MSDRPPVRALAQHETAELCRLIIESIRTCGVILTDPRGVITVWNRAAEELLGYSAREAGGRSLALLYPDATPSEHLSGQLEHVKRHGFLREDAWFRRRDGSLVPVNVTLAPLHDEGGALLGFSAELFDLTRERLLERCANERAELDFVLRTAEASTWKWNAGSDLVEVSGHLGHLLGYGGADRPAAPFEHWLANVHPDDRAALSARLNDARAGIGLPLQAELRVRAPDGAVHWIAMRADWRDDPEHQTRVLLGACVAIDALKSAETARTNTDAELSRIRNRYDHILEQMPSAVLLADAPSRRIIYLNRAAATLFGADSRLLGATAAFEGYHFADEHGVRVAPDDLPLARALRDNESTLTRDLTCLRPDGSRVDMAVTSAPIFDSDGVARVAVAVMLDISMPSAPNAR